MNINKKYYDYIIDDKNKHFHIVESLTKPKKNNSSIETLTKIEHILKNNLTYDSSIQDNFSNYNKEMLYNILKNNAIQIQSKFKEKESKKFLIIKNEAKVNSLVNNIENFVELSELFPLHPDATNEIINHLDIYDVGRLAQVNRRGKKFANPIIVDKAKELGFKGDDFIASKYITNLIKDFRKLLENNKFLIKYFENKKIFEALLHLSNILPNLELFKLLSIEDLYIKYPNIYPFLLKCTDECLEKFSLDKDKIDKYHDIREWNFERPKSPIMEAIHADKEEMVTLLLKHGSKVNSISQNSYCHGNFHYIGQAPLHLAIREGNIGIAKILLKHGADINIYSDCLLTPLHFAINNNQVEMVQFLLDQNAKVNNDNGYNEPLKEAISNGYLPIAELLLKYGANPDKPDYQGNTLLNKATKKNKLEIVQMLVKYKANPNIPSSNFPGQTPLQNAISKGYIDIAETLLEHEADMNIFNQEGDTALTLAIKKNDVEMIRLLLEHGVEVNLKISSWYSSKPFTALNVASGGLFPNKKIIELLKENGAKEE